MSKMATTCTMTDIGVMPHSSSTGERQHKQKMKESLTLKKKF